MTRPLATEIATMTEVRAAESARPCRPVAVMGNSRRVDCVIPAGTMAEPGSRRVANPGELAGAAGARRGARLANRPAHGMIADVVDLASRLRARADD